MMTVADGGQAPLDRARLSQVAAAEGCDEYELFRRAARQATPPARDDELRADFRRFQRSGELPGYLRWYLGHYLERHPETLERHLAGLRRRALRPWVGVALALAVIAMLLLWAGGSC